MGTKGCAAMTVGDIVERARVSRRTFYEHFRDKEDVVLAAGRLGQRFIAGRIAAELAGIPIHDWRARLRVSLQTYFETLAAEPRLVRSAEAAATAIGGRALELRAQSLAWSVAQMRALNAIARAGDPSIPELDDTELMLLVGGIGEVVRDAAREDRIERLPEQAPAVIRLAEAILSGRMRPEQEAET
ncbi:MAG: helix-turn-helix transcriptional regulator [Chloroflexi bacterium]|nr:MAG: helix-turn-helix transcriptional regulator [Chloroflexota bacterium]